MRTPSQLTPEELEALVHSWKHGPAPAVDIAVEYGVNLSSLRSFLLARGIHREYDAGRKATIGEDWTDADYIVQTQHDRELSQLKAQVNHYRRLYTAATKKDTAQDMILQVLRDNIVAWDVPSPELFKVSHKKSHGSHTLVALLSDLHVGEVVDKEAMMGMGEYNLDVFRQRAGVYVANFLRLYEIDSSGREIPKLTIFCDGDFISGLIHDELLKTNAVNVMDQMTLAATVGAWIIRQIAQYFKEVHVSCTVGNHGRTGQKVEFKDPSLSWDYMAYQMMAMLLKNDDHITWDIPKSLWAVTKVENLQFLHYHGHGRMQNTLSIPYYGIDRAIRDMREIFQVHDLKFDGMCMGHLHHFFEKDLGTGPVILNPCWKGGDEFATLGLRKYSKPEQVIFLVHHKRGYVNSERIHLWGQTPENALHVPEGPAPIWSDTEV